jgi:hypothetical protein
MSIKNLYKIDNRLTRIEHKIESKEAKTQDDMLELFYIINARARIEQKLNI